MNVRLMVRSQDRCGGEAGYTPCLARIGITEKAAPVPTDGVVPAAEADGPLVDREGGHREEMDSPRGPVQLGAVGILPTGDNERPLRSNRRVLVEFLAAVPQEHQDHETLSEPGRRPRH